MQTMPILVEMYSVA